MGTTYAIFRTDVQQKTLTACPSVTTFIKPRARVLSIRMELTDKVAYLSARDDAILLPCLDAN